MITVLRIVLCSLKKKVGMSCHLHDKMGNRCHVFILPYKGLHFWSPFSLQFHLLSIAWLDQSVSATGASLLFLKYSRHTPVLGPFDKIFPLPGMLFNR